MKLLYGSATTKPYSAWSAIGFLQRAAITRSSTPSPSRSPTNCGGPASSEQFSPNSLCPSSSVTAGTGDLACAGGGGAGFFSAESVAAAAKITSNPTKTRRQAIREDDIISLL